MPQNTIQDLPTEILDKILFYISDDSTGSEVTSQTSIKNIRLVSRRLKEVSRLVISNKLVVRLATKSLSRLEGLSLLPEFGKCITYVTIDLSYYDAQLAEDIDYFGEHMSAQLFRTLELADRRVHIYNTVDNVELIEKRLNQLWHVPNTLKRLRRLQNDDSGATTHQKNIVKLHKKYVRLTADQESIRLNRQHVSRFVTALKNLPNLHTIHLSDRLQSEYDRTHSHIVRGGKPLDDAEFLISALIISGWDGSMTTALKTTPPIEMLGELLSRLGNAGIRPRRVALSLGVPVDLTILRPTRAQVTGIQGLVGKSSDVDLSLRNWARAHSLAVDNHRSRNEILSLGSLITALTRTSHLQRLNLSLGEYPVVYQCLNINLSDLLQSNLKFWPKLSHIELNRVPFDLEELITLVSGSQEIVSFIETALVLECGDWEDVLDVLRSLKRLERCELRYLRDGRDGERSRETQKPFFKEKAEDYILGKTVDNPLRD